MRIQHIKVGKVSKENRDVVFHLDIRSWISAGFWHYQRHVARGEQADDGANLVKARGLA